MARKVFFSFHYDNDVSRAMVVRNSGMTKNGIQEAGFIDHADFMKLEKTGETAIKRWINEQLDGSTVTAVLIGAETLDRPYVQYEIRESYKRGNAIIGVFIDGIKDWNGNTSRRGNMGNLIIGERNGMNVYFSSLPLYNWTDDNGFENLGKWVEDAAIKAGKK
jgi:hypothetical protein